MSEEQLLVAITEALTLYGWRWHHVRRSDKALQQGHPGFPDICAARKGTVLFLELKSQRGVTSDAQRDWWRAIGPWYAVVRPDDLDRFLEVLAL